MLSMVGKAVLKEKAPEGVQLQNEWQKALKDCHYILIGLLTESIE